MATEGFVSCNRAADMLNVSRERVYILIQEGKVQATKSGNGRGTWLVSLDEVERLREVIQPRRLAKSLPFDPEELGEPVEVEEWLSDMRRRWAQQHHRMLPDGRIAIDACHL